MSTSCKGKWQKLKIPGKVDDVSQKEEKALPSQKEEQIRDQKEFKIEGQMILAATACPQDISYLQI